MSHKILIVLALSLFVPAVILLLWKGEVDPVMVRAKEYLSGNEEVIRAAGAGTASVLKSSTSVPATVDGNGTRTPPHHLYRFRTSGNRTTVTVTVRVVEPGTANEAFSVEIGP